MAEADILGALVALLAADPAVGGMTSHIHAAELPQATVAVMPVPALVVQASGGSSETEGSEGAVEGQRIDLIAFAATPREADSLRRAGRKALMRARRVRVSGVFIHWVNAAGGFYTARDRDGLWPQSFQSFQVLYATQEIN